MADEGVLFEGLRLGSTQAFDELLASLDPTIRRMALLYVPPDQVTALVRQTWSVALPGLDMFTWHTSLRAWLTGIFVTYGRARRVSPPITREVAVAVSNVRPAALRSNPPGPLPWNSLAWSSLWRPEDWRMLEDALAAQPLSQREVLWLHDVEGWPWREVLDTLGHTAVQGQQLLDQGRTALAVAVAAHVGAQSDVSDNPQRMAGVAALLAALRPVHPQLSKDPALKRLFTSWRRDRGVRAWRRWRWEWAWSRQ